MWVGTLAWAGRVLGRPGTDAYDRTIRASGWSGDPRLVLVGSRLFTGFLLLCCIILVPIYSSVFGIFHPALVFPAFVLLCVFVLEAFEVFGSSPLMLAVSTHVCWRRLRAEGELAYAFLLLEQLLGLGVPLESALSEMRAQAHVSALMREVDRPRVGSERIEAFSRLLSECSRVGATPLLLDDLVVLAEAERDRGVSRLRSLGMMAGHVFTYVLAVYTGSVMFIVVSGVTGGVAGLEVLVLAVFNPLLFALGMAFLFRWWSR